MEASLAKQQAKNIGSEARGAAVRQGTPPQCRGDRPKETEFRPRTRYSATTNFLTQRYSPISIRNSYTPFSISVHSILFSPE